MKKTRPALRQKSRFRSGSAVIASVALVAFGYAAVRIFAASGSATLYLTPAIGTYAPGQAVNVQVYTNTGPDAVNAVQADFSYPTAKLKFDSIDGTGSAFGLDALSTGGNGKVSIARGTSGGTSPVKGTELIATVHFTAQASGSASLAFLNTSHVVRASDSTDVLSSTTGAAYTIAVAATPTPSPHTPTPTPGKTATPKPSGSSTPSPTSSAVAAGGSASASPTASSSAGPSESAQPQSSATVVSVPTTTMPKHVDVLGVKVAGIPVLALAVVVVLLATAGVVFMMNRYRFTNVTSDVAPKTFTPDAAAAPDAKPKAPVTPAAPVAPSAQPTGEKPAQPSKPEEPKAATEPKAPETAAKDEPDAPAKDDAEAPAKPAAETPAKPPQPAKQEATQPQDHPEPAKPAAPAEKPDKDQQQGTD